MIIRSFFYLCASNHGNTYFYFAGGTYLYGEPKHHYPLFNYTKSSAYDTDYFNHRR